MRKKYASLEERIEKNSVDEEGELETPCRIWQRMTGGSIGYARMSIPTRRRYDSGPRKGRKKERRVYVHRLAKAIQLGVPIYRLGQCNHLCHRPNCINPKHIYCGTQAENVADRVEAGRTRNGHTGPLEASA